MRVARHEDDGGGGELSGDGDEESDEEVLDAEFAGWRRCGSHAVTCH